MGEVQLRRVYLKYVCPECEYFNGAGIVPADQRITCTDSHLGGHIHNVCSDCRSNFVFYFFIDRNSLTTDTPAGFRGVIEPIPDPRCRDRVLDEKMHISIHVY